MSLAIDTNRVDAVLLADGWHEVRGNTFDIDAYEYIESRNPDPFEKVEKDSRTIWSFHDGKDEYCSGKVNNERAYYQAYFEAKIKEMYQCVVFQA